MTPKYLIQEQNYICKTIPKKKIDKTLFDKIISQKKFLDQVQDININDNN